MCLLCSYKDNTENPVLSTPSAAKPYRPLLSQQQPQQPQPAPGSGLPPVDPIFGNIQTTQTRGQRSGSDYALDNIPTFVPRDPQLLYSALVSTAPKPSSQRADGGQGRSNPEKKTSGREMHFMSHIERARDDGFILKKNLNAVHIDLKARVTDVFGQIMKAISAHQETITNSLDEKFADIGERLLGQDKEVSRNSDITAEVSKVAEEINAKLAEAKLMIDVINSLESNGTLSSFLDYLSSNGNSKNSGSADLTPVVDTTLSKPMIRSWSDSTSQAAVLITWTTPRDFELLHRSEGFWYELEQRLASEPESAWHNVYKGVERTFVCKNMRRGTKYLFRCCVCVARHRYSNWSPEVLIVPGSGQADGKQNLIAPEISKALEQEVARSFTSGAVNAAGSSGPAVVTTVIVPINHSSSTPALPMGGDSRSTSPATASLSPSPTMQPANPSGTTSITTIATDPVQAASTIVSASSSAAAVAAAVAAAQSGSPGNGSPPSSSSSSPRSSSSSSPRITDVEVTPRGRKPRGLPLNWNTFIPGPFYDLSESNKVATARQPGAIVLGHVFPKNCNVLVSIQILRGSGVFFGVAPSGINQSAIQQHLYQGWFLDTSTLSIGSRPPYKWKAKPAYPRGDLSRQQCVHFPREGDIITLNYNSKTNTLRFSTVPGIYLTGKYSSLFSASGRLSLVPAVVLANTGDSVFLQSAIQSSV